MVLLHTSSHLTHTPLLICCKRCMHGYLLERKRPQDSESLYHLWVRCRPRVKSSDLWWLLVCRHYIGCVWHIQIICLNSQVVNKLHPMSPCPYESSASLFRQPFAPRSFVGLFEPPLRSPLLTVLQTASLSCIVVVLLVGRCSPRPSPNTDNELSCPSLQCS